MSTHNRKELWRNVEGRMMCTVRYCGLCGESWSTDKFNPFPLGKE